jgi:hypothetical protein
MASIHVRFQTAHSSPSCLIERRVGIDAENPFISSARGSFRGNSIMKCHIRGFGLMI